MDVTIAVAIPAYNAEPWIAETLETVLAQTHPAAEVIVVDDGSTDGTAAVAERFAARGVRVVRQANGGAPAAYNRGFAEARADYVAMCPADDLWEPCKLEWQHAALVAHPEIDVAFGGAVNFGLRSEPFARPSAEGLLEGTAFFREMYEQDVIAAPTAVVRRALHEELGAFREELFGEDYEFWMRALRAGATFFFDPRTMVRLRQHGGNLSSQAVQIWELNHLVHREFAPDLRDPRAATRRIAADLRAIGRSRLGLDDVTGANRAYRASLREQPTLIAALASAATMLPGSEPAFRLINRRRQG